MSLLNPAAAHANDLPAPLFAFSGKAARLDLSAMIAGALLAIGISRVGPAAIANDFQAGGLGLYIIATSYAAFLLSVLLLQRAMKLSMSATTFGQPQTFTTSGVFKFTRNPIYLSFFMPLAALSYFSLETAIASIVIYVTAMNLTVIRKEERELQSAFGQDYTNYRNSVPRWFA